MSVPVVGPERGSAKAIAEAVKRGAKISVQEMAKIAAKAEAAGGYLAAVDPDGDWCGTGRIHIKWPVPKKEELMSLFEMLVAEYINHEILINGIPAPEYIVINVSRKIGMEKVVGF